MLSNNQAIINNKEINKTPGINKFKLLATSLEYKNILEEKETRFPMKNEGISNIHLEISIFQFSCLILDNSCQEYKILIKKINRNL